MAYAGNTDHRCIGESDHAKFEHRQIMRTTLKKELPTSPVLKVVGALLCLAALTFFTACQGVSNGGSSSSNSSGSSGSTGSGDGQLSVTPSTLALGSAMAGASTTASASLSVSGSSVTITAANSSNPQFSVSGLSLPITIDAGKSMPFTVTFSPSAAGAANATLTFTSNAQPATTAETLTGTGTAGPTHTVNLSWNPSSSSNISGYNIYRAVYATSSCGSFAKINSTLNTGTLYTDAVVTDGTSYCYATTAVNTNNEESGYSNIVSPVQIPAP
jgi:hypothetical protein